MGVFPDIFTEMAVLMLLAAAEAARLEQSGSDLVLLPFVEAARGAADRLLGQQRVVVA